MSLQIVVDTINREIERLEHAKQLLTEESNTKRKYTRRAVAATPRKRHKMSVAARMKISAAQRTRWAKQKKDAA